MRAFRRERGRYVAELTLPERDVVARVLGDVADLLRDGAAGEGQPEGSTEGTTQAPADGMPPLHLPPGPLPVPEDPAVQRLLPDASREDSAVSAEFRRLTQGQLRDTKLARLLRVRAFVLSETDGWSPEAVVLTPADGPAVAAALTDVRLVLADRLGLDDDAAVEELSAELAEGDRPGADETRLYLGSVYDALSWLQETLLAVLLADLDRAGD